MKVHENGFIEIKTKKDAVKALTALKTLKDEIAEVKAESGIADMEKDAVAYSASLRDYMIENELDQLEGDGFHGTLVKGFFDSRWIATEDDLKGDEPATVQTLQSLIEKKFKSKVTDKGSKARKVWMRITRRIVDHDKIEELVADGTLKVDEISSAWVEKERAPYVRIFDDA